MPPDAWCDLGSQARIAAAGAELSPPVSDYY